MTTTIKQTNTSTHHIHICVEHGNYGDYISVEACPIIGDHICGYPERQYTYAMSEMKKAEATYKRYCKAFG